jgi:hypothetical protein
MKYPWLRKPLLAVALVVTFAGTSQAATLPDLEADSLGGTHVVLPRDAAGKRLVLLLAFTKESEGDVKLWSRKLLDNRIAGKDAVYVVVVADKTIFFGHSKVRKTVEQSTVGTKEQLNNNVLITFDGTGWRDLVPPGDKKTAGVVVCDANGSIVYAKREPFNDANLADVERAAD